VEDVGRIAEVAVVGSALIDVIEASPAQEREARVKAYVEVLAGRRGDARDRSAT
jgi:tryptophan synthase alpha subunit